MKNYISVFLIAVALVALGLVGWSQTRQTSQQPPQRLMPPTARQQTSAANQQQLQQAIRLMVLSLARYPAQNQGYRYPVLVAQLPLSPLPTPITYPRIKVIRYITKHGKGLPAQEIYILEGNQQTILTPLRDTVYVCITEEGKRYHRPNCGHIRHSRRVWQVSRDEAVRRGYTACEHCQPDD